MAEGNVAEEGSVVEEGGVVASGPQIFVEVVNSDRLVAGIVDSFDSTYQEVPPTATPGPAFDFQGFDSSQLHRKPHQNCDRRLRLVHRGRQVKLPVNYRLC